MRAGTAYEAFEREEIEPLVPAHARVVLDVGCYTGSFGAYLKRHRPGIEIWGIEPDESAATQAQQHLDKVIVGSFPDERLSPQTFDCVVFNDSLEHLVDPWRAIVAAQELLRPGGVVVASIPNVRYFEVSWKLISRGKWNYGEGGVLDRTHLRFFTRSSIRELFESRGYTLDHLAPWNVRTTSSRVARVLALFGDLTVDLRAMHYLVVARPTGAPIPSGEGEA